MKIETPSGFDWWFWAKAIGIAILVLDNGIRTTVFGKIDAVVAKISGLIHHQSPPPPPPMTPMA